MGRKYWSGNSLQCTPNNRPKLDICIPCRENHLSPKSGCKDLEPNAYFDEVRRFELLNVLVMLYSLVKLTNLVIKWNLVASTNSGHLLWVFLDKFSGMDKRLLGL